MFSDINFRFRELCYLWFLLLVLGDTRVSSIASSLLARIFSKHSWSKLISSS